MDNYELPSQWAKRMMYEAKDGNESTAYFELMNLWKEREDKNSTNS
ncbi:hypothetical protein ECH1_10 [Escherichia virus ECH1]